jgi:hypothetical protein
MTVVSRDGTSPGPLPAAKFAVAEWPYFDHFLRALRTTAYTVALACVVCARVHTYCEIPGYDVCVACMQDWRASLARSRSRSHGHGILIFATHPEGK